MRFAAFYNSLAINTLHRPYFSPPILATWKSPARKPRQTTFLTFQHHIFPKKFGGLPKLPYLCTHNDRQTVSVGLLAQLVRATDS